MNYSHCPFWKVTIETRMRDAMGKFLSASYTLQAPTHSAAYDVAFSFARRDNLETRFGLSATRTNEAPRYE